MFLIGTPKKFQSGSGEAGGHRRSGLGLGQSIREHQIFWGTSNVAKIKKFPGRWGDAGLGAVALGEGNQHFRRAIQSRRIGPRRGQVQRK